MYAPCDPSAHCDGVPSASPRCSALQLQRRRFVSTPRRKLVPLRSACAGVSPINVMQAICAAVPVGKALRVCDCLSGAVADLAACAGTGSTDTGMPAWAKALIAVVVVASVASIGIAVYLFRRTKRAISDLQDDYRSLVEGEGASDNVPLARPKRGTMTDRLNSLAASVLAPPAAGGAHTAMPVTSASTIGE